MAYYSSIAQNVLSYKVLGHNKLLLYVDQTVCSLVKCLTLSNTHKVRKHASKLRTRCLANPPFSAPAEFSAF